MARLEWAAPRAFRELVVDYQDGLNLRDRHGDAIPPESGAEDPYELGNRGINYRTERFAPRLLENPVEAWVMSSAVHGDPATPVFQAYLGDPVWIRLLQGSDRGRAHSFVMHGHSWHNQPDDPGSMIRTNRGGVMPGTAFNFGLIGGAGGTQSSPGDYLFRDGNLVNQVKTRNAWLGTIRRTSRAGAKMTMRVAGERIYVVGRRSPRGGRARVTIDGRSRMVSFRSARTRERQVVAELPAPRRGVHTVVVSSLGGGVVELDAIGALKTVSR